MALSIVGAVLLVTDLLFAATAIVVLTTGVAALGCLSLWCLSVWCLTPLLRRSKLRPSKRTGRQLVGVGDLSAGRIPVLAADDARR